MMPSNHDSPLFDAGMNPRNRRFQLPGNAGLLLDFGERPPSPTAAARHRPVGSRASPRAQTSDTCTPARVSFPCQKHAWGVDGFSLKPPSKSRPACTPAEMEDALPAPFSSGCGDLNFSLDWLGNAPAGAAPGSPSGRFGLGAGAGDMQEADEAPGGENLDLSLHMCTHPLWPDVVAAYYDCHMARARGRHGSPPLRVPRPRCRAVAHAATSAAADWRCGQRGDGGHHERQGGTG